VSVQRVGADLESRAILDLVDEHLREARAALGRPGSPVAVLEGRRLLLRVDELLASGVGDPVTDNETRRAMVVLRNELGSYLLAGSTLDEVGASPGAVIGLLQRGAETVDAMLDDITAGR
jgi:hypothetical protein